MSRLTRLTAPPLAALVLILALASSASAQLPLDQLPPLLDEGSAILDTVTTTVQEVADGIAPGLVVLPEPNIIALQGRDAIDAAIAFSQATFESADLVVIARNDVYADAVTTGAMQGTLDAPLLLTSSGDLDQRTAEELQRLGATRLIVLGGEEAVHPIVAQRMEFAGLDVTRVGGATRVETALAAAESFYPTATTAVLSRAYPAAGGDDSQGYADLLAVGPWAAANGWPILLSNTGELNDSVVEHIEDSRLTEIVIVGGEAAISSAVESQLEAMGLTVRRVAGETRYTTATAIAAERGFDSSADADRMILVEGTATVEDVWAAGFSGAAHGLRNNAPVLLTRGDVLPAETSRFITEGITENLTDGGPVVVCATFVSAAACNAAGLLALGNINQAAEALGIPISEIPGIDDIVAIIGGILGQDIEIPAAVAEVVDEVVDTATETVDGTVDDVVDAVGDATDAVDDATGGVIGGITGGGDSSGGDSSGGDSGSVTDPVTGAVGGATDPVTGAVGGATDAVTGATGVLSTQLDGLMSDR